MAFKTVMGSRNMKMVQAMLESLKRVWSMAKGDCSMVMGLSIRGISMITPSQGKGNVKASFTYTRANGSMERCTGTASANGMTKMAMSLVSMSDNTPKVSNMATANITGDKRKYIRGSGKKVIWAVRVFCWITKVDNVSMSIIMIIESLRDYIYKMTLQNLSIFLSEINKSFESLFMHAY